MRQWPRRCQSGCTSLSHPDCIRRMYSMCWLALIVFVHAAYDLVILKPISTLDPNKIREIGHKDDGCKGNRYGPVDPETRFHCWGTGWIAEIKHRHGQESLFIRASSVLRDKWRALFEGGHDRTYSSISTGQENHGQKCYAFHRWAITPRGCGDLARICGDI